jgi:hypothetical protein
MTLEQIGAARMIRKPFMFAIVILLLSQLTAMNLSMANEFKFGTWLYAGYTESPAEFLELLGDTLKFNFLITKGTESNIVSLLEAEGIKIAAKNSSPGLIDVPYYYSCSHYSVWEAEGNEFYHDSLKYEIGRFIQDGDVDAWMVSSGLGDTAGLFQYGPYYPQDVRFIGDPWTEPFVHYKATFRVKAGPDTTAGDDPVAALSVTVTYSSTVYTVAADTLEDSDFIGFDYMDDTLHYYSRYFHDSLQYTGTAIYGIEFRVHWFGKRDFYIDKVILCDRIGQELMTGLHNREIRDYVYTYFVNSPAIYAWYLREEIPTIDSYVPWRHVDSVLASVDSEKRGFSALCSGWGGPRELVNVIEPKEHHTDCYPLYGKRPWGGDPVAYASDCPCGDSVSLQTAWNQMIQSFDVNQRAALEKGIDFSTTVQAFSFYRRDLPPGDTLTWYWVWRIPTPCEIECQTSLSLAYGAKGVLYWKYWDGLYYDDGFLYQVSRGLIDSAGNRTENWHWIRDKIAPFIEKLGETFYNLNWLGACSCDSVNGFVLLNGQPSYIDAIDEHYNSPAYVEVGFFEDPTGLDSSYFFLVNRRCLESEGDSFDVFVTDTTGHYQIRDMYTDSVVDYVNGTGDYFTIYLGPGEGKLLRLETVYPGDANRDGLIDIADVLYLINYLFIDGPAPEPLEAGDVNCDGLVEIADLVYLINYLFIGGPPPCQPAKDSGE